MFDPVLHPAAFEVQQHLLRQKKARRVVCVPQGHRLPVSGLDAHKVAARLLRIMDLAEKQRSQCH